MDRAVCIAPFKAVEMSLNTFVALASLVERPTVGSDRLARSNNQSGYFDGSISSEIFWGQPFYSYFLTLSNLGKAWSCILRHLTTMDGLRYIRL